MGKYLLTPLRINPRRQAKDNAQRAMKGRELKPNPFSWRKSKDHAYTKIMRVLLHRRAAMSKTLTRRLLREVNRKTVRTPEEKRFRGAANMAREAGSKLKRSSLKSLALSRNHILADSSIAAIHEAITKTPEIFEAVQRDPAPLKSWLRTLSAKHDTAPRIGPWHSPDAEEHIEAFDAAMDDKGKAAALKKAFNAASMGLGNVRIGKAEDNQIISHGYDPELDTKRRETQKTINNRLSLYRLTRYGRNNDGSTPSKAQTDFVDLIFTAAGSTMSKLPSNRGRVSSNQSRSFIYD